MLVEFPFSFPPAACHIFMCILPLYKKHHLCVRGNLDSHTCIQVSVHVQRNLRRCWACFRLVSVLPQACWHLGGQLSTRKVWKDWENSSVCSLFFLFLAPGIQRNFFQNTSWSKVRNSDLSDHIPEKIQFCSKKVWKLTRLQ